MTGRLLFLASLLTIVIATPTAFCSENKPSSCWLTDYDKARAAARESGKPIFLVFRCEH